MAGASGKKAKATLPVYFATNRNIVKRPQVIEFGSGFNQAPNPMSFGRARATVKMDRDDFSAADCVVETVAAKSFESSLRGEITNAPGALLVSIHGFNYRFYEAVLRTAWLSQWYAKGKPGVQNTAVLFTWPSQGAFSLASYKTDVDSVQHSPLAFDLFFDELTGLIADYRKANPTGRVVLLAHSLGAYMLSVGLPTSLGVGPGRFDPQSAPRKLFDCAILAAPDADSDALRNPNKLQRLADVADRVAIYYNAMDIPLTTFSPSVHHIARLGVDGPPDKLAFKGLPYDFVNCSAASPSDDTGAYIDWQHHQYYRLIPEVRNDICGVISGLDPSQMPNRKFRKSANYYSLQLAPTS